MFSYYKGAKVQRICDMTKFNLSAIEKNTSF